eukprot:Skav214807  [mRNA]  locus=scaffold740:230532:231539:- [translate_table: standard]
MSFEVFQQVMRNPGVRASFDAVEVCLDLGLLSVALLHKFDGHDICAAKKIRHAQEIWLSTISNGHWTTHWTHWTMEKRDLLGKIRSTGSLPELLAHEESCRSRLTMQVESMYKMQKCFHRDQQLHVKYLRKQRENPSIRRMQLMPRFGDGYNQHIQLGDCFEQVQHMDEALSMIQTKKDQLQTKHRQEIRVKPIQASGARLKNAVLDSLALFNLSNWL